MTQQPILLDPEQQVADILLRCLSGYASPDECVFYLERSCIEVFLRRGNSPFLSISPVILEAITVFIDANPHFKNRALSCLVILSSCSPSTWDTVASSSVFSRYQEFGDAVASTIAGQNQWLTNLGPQMTESIADELLRFSDVSILEGEQRLYRLPPAPVHVALKRLCDMFEQETEHGEVGKLIETVLRRMPLQMYECLSDDDCVVVLSCVLKSDVTELDDFVAHMSIALSTESAASISAREKLRQYPQSRIAQALAKCSNIDLQENPSETTAVTSANEAFQEILKAAAANNSKLIKSQTKQWLVENKPLLVAAAYLAAPDKLHRVIEEKPEINNAVLSLPLELNSTVDASLDDSLANLLCAIPDISHLFCRRRRGDGKSCERALKRIALIHPYIVLRRFDSLHAVCWTVLHGLSNQEQKYTPDALHVLQVILDVVSSLPPNAIPQRAACEMCTDILSFLVDENRLENGIPQQFSPLTLSAFKLQSLLPPPRALRIQLEHILKAPNTTPPIRDAAQSLLSSLH